MRVGIDKATGVARRVLMDRGLSAIDATVVVDHLIDAQARGHASHGLYRLPAIAKAVADGAGAALPTAATGPENTATVSGNGCLGLVAADLAVRTLVELCGRHPVAVVATTGYTGTTGSVGYFTRHAAQHGIVAIGLCNVDATVAPAGGVDPVLGTNPIAISLPRDGEPITSDVSTAAMSFGKLALLAQRGEPAPEGVVLDADGRPSTDAGDAEAGSQLPLAGHKGYALGLAFELLAGPFIGAKAGTTVPGSNGLLLIGLRVGLFASPETFADGTEKLVAEIAASRRSEGTERVLLPGEGSAARRDEARAKGTLDVADRVWRRVLALARASSAQPSRR